MVAFWLRRVAGDIIWRSLTSRRPSRRSHRPPHMDSPEYDPLYLRGIEFFNDCEFFEAHEAWEELWTEYRGPARLFYQGLIQVAVALHHFGNGNIRGAKKLYTSSSNYLQAYRPQYMGLDLDDF